MHIPFKYLILYNNNNLISYTMKNKKIPNTPKYKFGGMNSDTKKNIKDFAGNYGKLLLDNSANALGIDAVGAGKGMNYTGSSADKFNKYSNVTGAISKSIAPMAMNAVIPGSGQIVSMGQQVAGGAYGQFGPQNEQGFNAYDNEGNPIVNQNDRSAQFGQMAGQIGGMVGGMMGGGSEGMGSGFMPNLPSGTPSSAMRYGGQMKFAMGGMNKYPGGGTGEGNSQIELDENSTINGKFTQYNQLDHNQQDPNQPNASLAPGEKVFSAKLKIGNKTIADLNKANNTNREDKLLKDSTLGKTSALSLHLTKMAKMKNSDVLFAMQEQLKKDKVAAYAKKMGVEIPSMDNQQMSPQGMPGQPQGGMPMVRHGGMFAMGGVQLPYYNTDNAGNPIYAMGGGYPAMTNPYHNFKGSIPMYEDGGNMPEDQTTNPSTTTPTTNGTTFGTRPLTIGEVPALKKTGYEESNAKVKDRKIEMYNNPDYLIQHQNIDGTKWNDFQKFMSTYKLPNGQNFVGNEDANTNLSKNYTDLVMSDYNKTLSQKYKDNPDEATRRSISLGDLEEVQKYYNQGDPNLKVDRILGGEATQLKLPHFSTVSKRTLKPGEYMPITYGGKQYVVDADTYNTKFKDAWEGKSNENLSKYFQSYDPKKHMNIDDKNVEVVNRLGTIPGGSGPFVKKGLGKLPTFIYRAGQGTQEEQWKNYQKENGLAFKYGGQMPKYFLGGINEDGDEPVVKNKPITEYMSEEEYQSHLLDPYSEEKKAAQMAWLEKKQNNDYKSFLAKTDDNKVVDNTSKPYMGNSNYISPEDEYNRDLAAANARATQKVPGAGKPNWMDIVGKGVNFAAQNMGNIYDLSRKDAPLQSYERATGKFLDPTQARRDEQYAYRQANKAIPGLVGGSGAAAMNLLGANRAKTSTNIGRINKEYENANAQIGNQLNQFNTEIAYREAEARAKDAAMKENIRSQAIHGIGTSVGKATKSGKEDVMDQKTLEMYKQYYNNPQFRAALKKAGYDV